MPDTAIARQVEEATKFVGQVLSSSVCPNLPVEFVKGRRGSINKSFGGKVRIAPDSPPSSVVHELGHEIEDQPGIKQATAAFLKRRCGTEKSVPIRDVDPDATQFPKKLKGRKDDFDRYFEGADAYYVGMTYPDGSSEVISKGLQAMYDDPARFAHADPDYFDFIVDILAGNVQERQASG